MLPQEDHLIVDDEVNYLNTKVSKYFFLSKIIFQSNNTIFVAYQKNKDTNTNIDEKTQRFAIKPYLYESDEEKEKVKNEIQIVELFNDDPKFISYIDYFDLSFRSGNYMFIVMNYYYNLDLFDLCCHNQTFFGLSEMDSCYVAYQALKILKKMKDRQIVHHDVKIENFLIVSKSPIKILLTDFEYAEVMTCGVSTLYKGTPYIRAPEVINETPHDSSADMWSLGLIIFQILYSYIPFNIDAEYDDLEQILHLINNVPLENPGTASLNAWELVSSMLQIDPKDRITVEDALNSDWFRDINDELVDTKSTVSKIISETEEIAKYNKNNKIG